jgi:hypothetical protein
MGLSYTIAAGLRQCIYSQVRVPQDSWPHFTVSDSRLPQPGVQAPYLYPPRTGWPSYIFPTLGSHSVAFYDRQGYSVGNSNPLPHPRVPVCYVLTHKFRGGPNKKHSIADFWRSFISVFHWSKPVYQMHTFVSVITLSSMLIYWR